MAVYFLDTSVFFRAYMSDDPRHSDAMELLLGGRPLVGSELLRVEAVRAMRAAERAGRVSSDGALELLSQMDSDSGPSGIVKLIDFDGPPTLARALSIVLEQPVRTLDALHLAVADREGRRFAGPDDELVFATFDERQRDVARALGLAVL
jgi:predicted nucleic acid-binding protein